MPEPIHSVFLSVIVPAYNEQSRIIPTLTKIKNYLTTQKYSWEVIIVNDGSADATGATVSDFIQSDGRFSLLENTTNRGKGYSIRQGALRSSGAYILFSDSDLSTPIEEVEKLFATLNAGFDIAIGSRSVPGARVVVSQPVWRKSMGKLFNTFIKAVLMRDFNDTQCGFKLFKGDIGRSLFEQLLTEGFAFDVEVIYRALRRGYSVKEVGIVWANDLHSKVHPFIDSLHMLWELLTIYYRKNDAFRTQPPA